MTATMRSTRRPRTARTPRLNRRLGCCIPVREATAKLWPNGISNKDPDRAPAVSTASGREEAMDVVHTLAESSNHDVAGALKDVKDTEASAEALRHVLIGGTHSVEAFSEEVAEAEGGEPLPAHKMTKIIGEVLAELDK